MIELIDHLVYDKIGLIHLITSVIALITGTANLVMEKGTSIHKKIGTIYAISMLILLITAFMIYRLFGGWGLFHWAAVASSVTLAGGMIPILLRKPKDSWLEMHFSFMYWSVMGLYMAFAAEVLTRIPKTPFFGMVGLATGAIGFGGGFYFYSHKEKWAKEFEKHKSK